MPEGGHSPPPVSSPLFLPSMHGGGVDGGPGSDTNPVGEAEAYTYLGVCFQTDRPFDNHIKTKAHMNGVEHRLRGCLVKAEGVPPLLAAKLIMACGGSVLCHAAAAWAPATEPSNGNRDQGRKKGQHRGKWRPCREAIEGARVNWNRYQRFACGATWHTPMAGIQNLLGQGDLYDMWAQGILAEWERAKAKKSGM